MLVALGAALVPQALMAPPEAALQQQLMDQNSLAYMGNRWTTSHKGKSSCFQEVPVRANCEERTCPKSFNQSFRFPEIQLHLPPCMAKQGESF